MSKRKTESNENKYVNLYKKNYKKLLIFPALLFVIALVSIFYTIGQDGSPIYRDISLKGGLSAVITVNSDKSVQEIEESLEGSFDENNFAVSELFEEGIRTGFIIDTDLEEEEFKSYIEEYFNTEFTLGDNYNSNFISPTLSSAFFKQAVYILLISLVLMSIVIFLYFREVVPSSAVVLSAIFDVIVTIGILDMFRFEISIAGIGALLMLIGYSIDTDVLLTNRLIKEFGFDYFEKTWFAFKTGVLMSFTTLIAGFAALIITNSEVIFEIALILVVGLLVDFISTWVQNSGILLWWLEKKHD